MTKDEFIALPPDQRKKLAAQRSLERNLAKKTGKPLPPTLGEEFGLNPVKTVKPPKEVKEGTPATLRKKILDNNPMPDELKSVQVKREPGTYDLAHGVVVTKRGHSQSSLRTIMNGLLHCVHLREEGEKYKTAALKKGFKWQMDYFDGGKPEGRVFFEEFNQKRFQAIILGSRPDVKLSFGKKEAIK